MPGTGHGLRDDDVKKSSLAAVYKNLIFGILPSVRMPTTVGIEIEVNQKASYNEDIATLIRESARLSLSAWTFKMDGSCGKLPGQVGVEAVSPKLRDFSHLLQIDSVVGLIKAQGHEVNSRCGLHVHLGMQHTTAGDRMRLIKLLSRYEDAFFMLAQACRQDNIFCSKLDPRLINEVRQGHDTSSWRSFYHIRNPRYFWINGSMSKFKTFEFRLMGSVLDAQYIVGWTSLLLMAYENVVTHHKNVRWGRAKAKTPHILICTLLEQAGVYNKCIEKKLQQTARKWAMSQIYEHQKSN